jgi:hypothetical protein
MRQALVISALLLLGCPPDNKTTATDASAALSATAKTSAVPSAKRNKKAPFPDEDVPVPADFEEEAETKITADNYKDELEKIEGELFPKQEGDE